MAFDPPAPLPQSTLRTSTQSLQAAPEPRDADQFADLLERLSGIASVTVHRGKGTPEAQLAGAKRMAAMLMRFPHAVAIQALERWPNEEDGRWFPTEHDLQRLCVDIQRRHTERPRSEPTPEYTHSEAHRREMKGKLAALSDWMKSGRTHGIPELERAQATVERREQMARDAGYASVTAWMAGKR